MKKVSIAFDVHFSSGAFEFVKELHDITPVQVTGCFLKESDFVNASVPVSFGSIAESVYDDDLVQKSNIHRFSSACKKNNLPFRIHDQMNDVGFEGLRKQTRYSDLLVVSSELFFRNISRNQPNEYLKDLLHISECPVIMVPEKFVFPSTIVLAYDGTEASTYAIREFANLLPELCEKKTMLVYGNDRNDQIPDLNLIKEFASCHFSNFAFSR